MTLYARLRQVTVLSQLGCSLGASVMASPDAHSFTCERWCMLVSGSKLALMCLLRKSPVCGAWMEQGCYAPPPLLEWALLSLSLEALP